MTNTVAELPSQAEVQSPERVFSKHFNRLYNFIYYRVQCDTPAAEDVMQDTFLALVQGWGRFDIGNAYALLCGIARNRIRLLQRAGVRRAISFAEVEQIVNALEEPSALLPEETLQREETKLLVNLALSELPVHYQEVLELKYQLNLSTQGVAARMEKSVKAVESLLARAKEQFAAALRKHSKGDCSEIQPE